MTDLIEKLRAAAKYALMDSCRQAVLDAADEIEELRNRKGGDDLTDYLSKQLDDAHKQMDRLREERDFAISALRRLAEQSLRKIGALEADARDAEQASKYYEEMAIRLYRPPQES